MQWPAGLSHTLRPTELTCTAFWWTALCCTELHCTALHCTEWHSTALHCIALQNTAQHCTALHLTAMRYTLQIKKNKKKTCMYKKKCKKVSKGRFHCIGASIGTHQEIHCVPYAGFFWLKVWLFGGWAEIVLNQFEQKPSQITLHGNWNCSVSKTGT